MIVLAAKNLKLKSCASDTVHLYLNGAIKTSLVYPWINLRRRMSFHQNFRLSSPLAFELPS
jgi:hypothetical protein